MRKSPKTEALLSIADISRHFSLPESTTRYYCKRFAAYIPSVGEGRRRRYRSETLDGEFTGGVVLDDTLGLDNNGVAQGGLVQTNDGRWYSMMIQDRGAAGRFPVLVPVDFSGQMPVFGVNGRVPEQIEVTDNRPHYEYEPLWCSDDFH